MNILSERYSHYCETAISNRFIKHADLVQILNRLKQNELFTTSVAGHSFEGRSLNLIKAGTGGTKVFIWSQMLGDEATATMAICDLLNFFVANDDLNELRARILESCTLYILPMVNPDGAEIFTRRNAQGIDINRDFHKQQTPEGRVLRSLRDQINPQFGFNMHDQSTLWSAGVTGNPATISVLAPAYDAELSINLNRERAIQVINNINSGLQKLIPRYVGRFDDEHEPRAFGDNFQASGTSTILIEAGGYKDDPEKQFIRKITFIALLTGLDSIAGKNYLNTSARLYFDIPENAKKHFHIILRNCKVISDQRSYTLDIGLVAEEKLNADQRSTSLTYLVDDIGDLTGFYAYEDVDASAYQLILTRPLTVDENADFILQDNHDTILCIENGRITSSWLGG
ncbi:MAG TPA: M14 family zinc carboxypeptidase [Daejeonella sp.]|nr:M14 family zinc carboxypeptidase [Daejeonella sp.]